MCRSYKAFFSVILMLGISFMISAGASAESLQGYEIASGEGGGSYLPAAGKMIINGGDVVISGSSSTPLSIVGDVKLTLRDVEINSNSGAAISIDSGVKAEIILEGENVITGHDSGAGINVGYDNNSKMAVLEINGDGSLIATGGIEGGAGIGGNGVKNLKAVYGKIVINGGDITALAQKNSAGIGGGLGVQDLLRNKYSTGEIIINGGVVSATGKNGGAGIGGGPFVNANVTINGGSLKTINGGTYAAGIGGGSCNENVNIAITGGELSNIKGYESDEDESLGGAAIGSGAKTCEYSTRTQLNMTGGMIEDAVAGWGASGIGSGASNELKSEIVISENAQITKVYTDGIKMPLENGAMIEGKILQAVFSKGVDTDSETSLEVVNYDDESEAYKMSLPKGYRAFATSVEKAADYSIRGSKYYADKELSGDEDGGIKLNVGDGALAAYENLYPVEKIPDRELLGNDEGNTTNELIVCIFLGILVVGIISLLVSLGVMSRRKKQFMVK